MTAYDPVRIKINAACVGLSLQNKRQKKIHNVP